MPDCVYVIPANAELTVVNGRLKLGQPKEPRGMRLPINVLFSSLASARNERAIAVVLSGMGSDGTLGLQAIRAVGGLAVPDKGEFTIALAGPDSENCADTASCSVLAFFRQVGHHRHHV
ncbi:MAG: hypothetical protein H5U31_08170 [Marinobacter sp.]|nr:hypothetical protein [Marinobacter sp.]